MLVVFWIIMFIHNISSSVFKNGFHSFHIVDMSPWPLVGSFSVFSVVLYLFITTTKNGSFMVLLIIFFSFILVCHQWWRDVSRESVYGGCHTKAVSKGLKYGMILFILSEVMFFFSFFFSFFFVYLVPSIDFGLSWPPKGIQAVDYMMAPLLNTILLLSSGVSITWCHHAVMHSNLSQAKWGVFFTVLMGSLFTYFQALEYYECSFSMSDGFIGSIFFMATGFHGFHVLIGTFFIVVSSIRMMKCFMSSKSHLGLEMAIWYWHFVDVVWLFLFICMYWL